MNRQLKPLFLLGTALLLATACTNDDTDTVDITRPIDLHLSPARTVTAETKVAIDGETFDGDDVIGLYLAWTDGATAQVPIAQTITQTTWKGNAFDGESLYWQNTADVHTIYAYYPYADGVTGHTVPVTLPATQTAENEETCNILHGTFTGKAQNNVQIQMGHCMSLVNITLKPGDGYQEDGSDMPIIKQVDLIGAYHTSGTLDLGTGTVTTTGTTANAITTYASKAGHRAILMPGETLGDIVITTNNGTTYTYTPTETTATAANTQYNFTLELNKAGVTLGNLTIEKWSEEVIDENGDANMDIPTGN